MSPPTRRTHCSPKRKPDPVVAPYLIEAVLHDGHPYPLGLREEIRAFGPTVRPEPVL